MSTRSTNKLPVLDEDAITELERGLPGGDLSPALQTFGEELERRVVTLEELVATENQSGLASLAHGLKGSASTFHAPRLASAASTLEEELKAPDPHGIHTATTQLSAELRRVVRHLHDLLERRMMERK
jgi:HPt (histidine-containing phosphotransfer) domain-containing protein